MWGQELAKVWLFSLLPFAFLAGLPPSRLPLEIKKQNKTKAPAQAKWNLQPNNRAAEINSTAGLIPASCENQSQEEVRGARW